MNDLFNGILFILFLVLIGALVWAWRQINARLNAQDEKLSGSLDDLDLVEFQENVAQLLEALHTAGDQLVRQAEERSRSMQTLTEKSKDLEKRLTQRLAQFEKQLAKADSLYAKMEARIPAKAQRPPAKTEKIIPKPALAKFKALAMPEADASVSPTTTPMTLPAAEEDASETGQPVQSAKPAGKYSHVQEMSERGMSVEQIAREAHLLPGEIELILRLGKKR